MTGPSPDLTPLPPSHQGVSPSPHSPSGPPPGHVCPRCPDRDNAFPTFLRTTIKERGVSLTVLAEQLRAQGRGVSKSTLSHWQSGRSYPDPQRSLGTLTALEDILGLDPGALIDRLQAPRRRGRSVPDFETGDDIPVPEVFREGLLALGFEGPRQIPHTRVVHELLEVDSSRAVQRFTFHVLVRARADGIVRLPALFSFEDEHLESAPPMFAMSGCRIGTTFEDDKNCIYGMAVEAEGFVQTGTLVFFSYGYIVPVDAQRLQGVFHSVPHRASELVVEAAFRGPDLPLGLRTFRDPHDGEEVEVPAQLDGRGHIQSAAMNFGPGAVGIRWRWE